MPQYHWHHAPETQAKNLKTAGARCDTRSLAVKGHEIQGSPVKILPKIRVNLSLIRLIQLSFWHVRITLLMMLVQIIKFCFN